MSPYEEVILEHWRHPRNKGRLEAPDVDVVEANPLCGDVVRLQLKVRDGLVEDVRFDGGLRHLPGGRVPAHRDDQGAASF